MQYVYCDIYDEDNFVVILGGLHAERMLLSLLGDWFKEKGWTHIWSSAGVVSTGVTDSLLVAYHKKTI